MCSNLQAEGNLKYMYILADKKMHLFASIQEVRVTGDKDGASVGGTIANCGRHKIRGPEKWLKIAGKRAATGIKMNGRREMDQTGPPITQHSNQLPSHLSVFPLPPAGIATEASHIHYLPHPPPTQKNQ